MRGIIRSTHPLGPTLGIVAERLLPSDDPVSEEVLEWTIKRDAQDISQLMGWLSEASARKDREILVNRALDLMEEIRHAMNRLDELR